MRRDLAVIGGGPAGLATAIRAAGAGLQVTVIDPKDPPIDKACGEGLMPAGVRQLEALGLGPVDRLGRRFHGIRYIDGAIVAEGAFPRGHGLGVRRLELHQALVRRASERGVDLRWGTGARGLVAGGVETTGGLLQADWVVGADGLHSRVRRWAGLDVGRAPRRRRKPRYGVRRHYAVEPWSDRVEVTWGRGAEAYVTPVGADAVGVALLWSGRRAGFDELIRGFPELEERLRGQSLVSEDRGAGPLRQRVRAVTGDRLALVGDASGYIDAITGEGLSLAFEQAAALVPALVAGDLAAYARAHRKIGRWPDTLTRAVLGMERHPWLRRRVVRTLAARPDWFSRLLGQQDSGTLGDDRVGMLGEPGEP